MVEGYLWVRNRIYYRVFDNQWIRVNMPDPEKRRQRKAFAWGAAVAASIAFPVILLIGLLFLQAYWNRRLGHGQRGRRRGHLDPDTRDASILQGQRKGRARADRDSQGEARLAPRGADDHPAEESDPLFQRLLTITLESYETLPPSQKQTTMYLRVMAAIEHDVGDIAHDLKKFPESEKFYRKAVKDQKDACELARKNYSLVYRTFQGGKARIREYQLKLNEYYASLIASSLAAGHGEEAEKAAHERRAQCAGEPGLLYDFARALARTGRGGDREGIPRRRPGQDERARLDGLAIQALEQAVAEGYTDISGLRNNSDFDPLQTQPAYVRLVSSLGTGGRGLAPK